jgi:hypothetical protein
MNEKSPSTLDAPPAADGRQQESPPERHANVESAGRDVAVAEEQLSLFSDEQTTQFRARWDDIQTGFVDQPNGAVERADALVAEVMSRLAESFARRRSELESQWKRGDEVSTEDLRQALRRYRTFFGRLLSD